MCDARATVQCVTLQLTLHPVPDVHVYVTSLYVLAGTRTPVRFGVVAQIGDAGDSPSPPPKKKKVKGRAARLSLL